MLNMQNVKDIEIPEGDVRTIHDKDDRLIWGRLAYDTKYAGDTYQQTYHGYQLLPTPYASGDSRTHRGITYEVNPDGTITMNGQNDGTASSAYFFIDRYGTMPLFELEAGTYYFIPNDQDVRYEMYDGSSYYTFTASNNYTVTFQNNVSIRQIYAMVLKTNTTTFTNYKLYPMLTKLQSPTTADYEPYTGSTSAQASPAPNPDYPQAVQVVTGEQTVTIGDGVDSEDFTISLGTIELCKIGTYQDYIYKNGADWYVHKACGKIILNGSETWNRTSFTVMTDYKEMYSPVLDNVAYYNNVNAVCNNFSNVGYNLTPSASFSGECFSLSSNQQPDTNKLRFAVLSSRATDANIFKTWLSEHNTSLYYALATPTDTKITDATLIGQLNAIHEWLIRYGYNATVTGNLPIIINQTNL